MSDVLLVEDERELAGNVSDYLAAFGLSVQTLGDAESALALLRSQPAQAPRVLLLDVNLPGMSGFELCRVLRGAGPPLATVPILFLTARSSEDDEVLALSIGGDDYLRKPFPLGVLLARIRRALARLDADAEATAPSGAGPREHRPVSFSDERLRIDAETSRVYVAGQEIALPAMEYRLLTFLASERERVLGKQEILESVWGDTFVGDGTLAVHVRRLRAKIEPDPEHPRYLRTVWGRGYVFTAEGSGNP